VQSETRCGQVGGDWKGRNRSWGSSGFGRHRVLAGGCRSRPTSSEPESRSSGSNISINHYRNPPPAHIAVGTLGAFRAHRGREGRWT